MATKIGVTGTRKGMTPLQAKNVERVLRENFSPGAEFHHGDCVGVDGEAAVMARDLGYKIVCHPPQIQEHRYFFPADEFRQPINYFARNRNIVDETDKLIVVPLENEHQDRGGTWYTHDYAVRSKKPRIVVYPFKETEYHD